jgi:hypothetical protein
MALWSESRGLVGGVGGWPVWLQWRRFQRVSGRNGVRRGRLGAPRCKAGVAMCCTLDVVQLSVRCGPRGGVRALEREPRSGRAGRPDGLALTWLGGGVRSRSRETGSGN